MLIDWLTLRFPITPALGEFLHDKIQACMGHMTKISSTGEIEWEKQCPDWDSLRSDSQGLYWSITGDGSKTSLKQTVYYLTIGGSPASIANNGMNVFGTLDVATAAQSLIDFAGRALGSILPNWRQWQCRRMDVTANYDMGSAAQVKQALRLLLGTDAPRRRTNSDLKGGDTVYWNLTSDLRKGKAYHKGAHLRFQSKKGNIILDAEIAQLADRLLRLELQLGARWFRRLDQDWRELTPEFLAAEHLNFFASLIGGGDVEVSDMGILLQELEKVAPSKGYALGAHRTWALIKSIGYTQTQDSMNKNTFRKHCQFLRAAGLSSADLCAGVVIPFRQKTLVLGNPVLSWDELRRAA